MANALNRSDKSELRMNLGALQRLDPFIAKIIASTKQVRRRLEKFAKRRR